MKKEKYTLANGMESYKITAEEGKVLVRTNDGMRCGSERSLGMAYRDKDGNVLSEPYLEKVEDYTEDDMTEEEKKMYEEMSI